MDLSLNKLPWYAQLVLFGVLSIAGVFVFWYFYASTADQEILGRQAQLDAIRADINKGLTTARQLNEFRKEVGQLQAQLDRLTAVLPERKDIAELINTIQNLAVQSNMTIRAVKPQPAAAKQMHEEWPISLELEGTYHNLGAFFDRISNFPRIINVSNVVIKSRERPEPNTTITAECVATTFVLLAQPKPAAAPAAAPAAPPAAPSAPAAGGF
jgi:type IV pilus assembly protein PilO